MIKSSKKPKIMVVDDEISTRESMRLLLYQSYDFLAAESTEQALDMLQNGQSDMDVVFTDIHMPGRSGIFFLRQVKRLKPELEVIIITGYPSSKTTISALRYGASDYLTKPFSKDSVLDATKRALARKRKAEHTQWLITNLRDQVKRNYSVTTNALIQAIDAKDSYTKGHCKRITELMKRVAKHMDLPAEEAETWSTACLLHDIGKIGISETILLKPSSLQPEELAEIEQHPIIGYNILTPIDCLQDVLPIILHHHERYDGLGYPNGLAGKSIPRGARVLAILDSYDAMTTDRPYRRAMTHSEALKELSRNSGTQFDPDVLTSVTEVLHELSDK